MEIERKWLTDGFFDEVFPLQRTAVMEQGYLCTAPVVRIRKTQSEGQVKYILCFKGKGTLSREEIELPLTESDYARLCTLLPMPPVVKEFRSYKLPGGETLECSLVDPGADTAFYYAEVEFDTEEDALAFVPPADFVGEEKTEESDFTMGSYWNRKLLAFQNKS